MLLAQEMDAGIVEEMSMLDGVPRGASSPIEGEDVGGWGAYSLSLLSSQIVTGPSLTSETCMSAPKRPVPTLCPRRSSSA